MSVQPQKKEVYAMDYDFRFKYETLRSLLEKNGNALQILSDLEADLNHMRHYDPRIKLPIQMLITKALLMAQELNLMTGNDYSDLYEVLFRLRYQADGLFLDDTLDADAERSTAHKPFVVSLDPMATTASASELPPDPAVIGGKAFGIWQLGREFEDLTPPGFVVTTAAYNRIIQDNHLHDRIRLLLTDLDVIEDQDLFQSRTETIRRLIRESTVCKEIETAMVEQIELFEQRFSTQLWAVRSSAVCEDSIHSFAGQFDSELQIKKANCINAYLNVLAGRFTDRAVRYRIHHHFREVDTPMAVLFMPMVDAASAGVVHTCDTRNPDSNTLVVSTVQGLANRMVTGEEQADTFMVEKGKEPLVTQVMGAKEVKAATKGESPGTAGYISHEKVLEIARIAMDVVARFGHELDIEWAIDKTGKIRFLQARPLNITGGATPASPRPTVKKESLPLLAKGITIFPGRAEGPLVFWAPGDKLSQIPEGAIVLVAHPRPELGTVLPKIAALLVMEGSPVGHLATLVREFSVPSIFRMGENAHILLNKNILSVNATERTVYDGVRWPGIRERVLARIARKNRQQKKSGPLYDLILALNLLDPDAPSFKAGACRSVHDTLRFMHEMAVRTMFGFGDRQDRGWNKKSKKLVTDLPIKFQLIDLDGTIPEQLKKVTPESVASVPFKALWQGIMDKRLAWPERWEKQMRGMPSDFKESVLGGNRGPRRTSEKNYAILARDYMNLNARFDYHYAMVDAMVGPGTEHNHVHFRFRGGGASDENRARRARFLERVLRQEGFGVDRSKDLVTAWFRRYPRKDSENALERLGLLMVCARQLDAVLKSDGDIKRYADYFANGEFKMFL